MWKLAAVDLDGTLLTSGKAVTEHCREVVRDLLELGIRFVLASARPPRSTAGPYKALGLRDLVICYNGALIFDPPGRRVLHRREIEYPLARALIDLAREVYPDVQVSVEVLDPGYAARPDGETELPASRETRPDRPSQRETWDNTNVAKILMMGEPSTMQAVKFWLDQSYAERVALMQIDPSLLQIMAAGVSKGAALEYVARYYGIRMDETLAIGDGPNDLSMLRVAGMAVAMGDAPDEVRAAADYVAASSDEDGVADVLSQFILAPGGEPLA